MAAKIFILAFAAVMLQAECQLNGQTIYKNPLRPPFAAESSVFASATASGSSGPSISQIPGAVSKSLSSSSSTTSTESLLQSSSTPLDATNEMIDETFSKSSQQAILWNSQHSKPFPTKTNSKALNYSPLSKRFPSLVKNNVDTGIKSQQQYLSNPSPRLLSPGCNSQTNFEGLGEINPNLEQPKKPFYSTAESSATVNPVYQTNFELKETPGLYCSSNESPFQRTWITPKLEEVTSLTNCEMESFPNPRESQLSSIRLYNTPTLEKASQSLYTESSNIPTKRFSALRRPQTISKNYPISEESIERTSSNCNDLKTARNWNRTPNFAQTGNELVANSLETEIESMSAIDSEYTRGITSEALADINNFPSSITMNIPQTPVIGPIRDGCAKSYDINELKKLNPVPSFIGITEIFNTGHTSFFENPDLSLTSTNVAEASALDSGPSTPFSNSGQISDTPYSIAQSSAISEIVSPSKVNPNNLIDSFSYQQPVSAYTSNFYPELMSPVSIHSTAPTPVVTSELFSKTSNSVSSGLGQSDFRTFSSATSSSSAEFTPQVMPSFPYNKKIPSLASSSPNLVSTAEASSYFKPALPGSAAYYPGISSLGSAQARSNRYFSKSYSPPTTSSASLRPKPSKNFASNTLSSGNIAETKSYFSSDIDSSSFPLSDTTYPVFTSYAASQSKDVELIAPAKTETDLMTSSFAATKNKNPFFNSCSASEVTKIPDFTTYAVSQTIDVVPTVTEVVAPADYSPITTAESTSAFSTSYSSSEVAINPVLPSYTDSQTTNTAPSSYATSQSKNAGMIAPAKTEIDLMTSPFVATKNKNTFFNSYGASEATKIPDFTTYAASQTIDAVPTVTEVVAPAGYSPITTEKCSTIFSTAAAESNSAFSTSYSSSEAAINPVSPSYTDSQTTNTAPSTIDILDTAVDSLTAVTTSSTTSSTGAFENSSAFSTSYSASETTTNSACTSNPASQTISGAIFQTTTGMSLTPTSTFAAENIVPFSTSYSASGFETNPTFTPYTASQAMRGTPLAPEDLEPTVSLPISTGLGSSSSIVGTGFSPSYSSSKVTSELFTPMTYSPIMQNVNPMTSSIVFPTSIPQTTYPISTSYATESISSVPIATETFPISYALSNGCIDNTTPIMSSVVTSINPVSYASLDTMDITQSLTNVISPLTSSAVLEYNPISSSAVSKSETSISLSNTTPETAYLDQTLTEFLPVLTETMQDLPFTNTVPSSTASVSSATEFNSPSSLTSASSSVATTSTVEFPIANSVSTVSQASTSSSLPCTTPDATTSFSTPVTKPTFSRTPLPSQNLYSIEVSPLTLEVQIPSSLGSSYISPNFGYVSSRAGKTISSPFMYELQIPSSMAAQLSCSLGSTQTNLPVLCMNVENVASDKFW